MRKTRWFWCWKNPQSRAGMDSNQRSQPDMKEGFLEEVVLG